MSTGTYLIKTYGCQMNIHDSERMSGILQSMGYSETFKESHADIILINTCSVREKADQKLFSKLGRLDVKFSGAKDKVIAVCGCIAQRDAEKIFTRVPFVNLVIGPRAIPQLPEILLRHAETGERQVCVDLPDEFDEERVYVRRSSILAYVTIMEGCNKFCSYCIVPYTRGREISRPSNNILDEVRELAEKGFKEIHLLGQNVNAYSDRVNEVNFPELLRRVSDVSGIERIRFITSHPRHLDGETVAVMAERANICNAIHLPPQSGSSAVLKRMNRRYTREGYLDAINLLREQIGDISLSGDVIVGFPGETEADFQETLSLLQEVRFASLFSFVYSPRPGTKAAGFEDDVSQEEKLDRLYRLQKLQAGIQTEKHMEMTGTEQMVLFDGFSAKRDGQLMGRTDGNLVVNMYGPEELVGEILKVRITRAGPHHLVAECPAVLTNETKKN